MKNIIYILCSPMNFTFAHDKVFLEVYHAKVGVIYKRDMRMSRKSLMLIALSVLLFTHAT